MLQPIPQLGMGPAKLIGTFKCITPITIQVIGPQTLYLANSDNALTQANDAGVIDAFQINQATGIFILWVSGDLYAAGSSPFQALFYIPGTNTGSGLAGSDSVPANDLHPSVKGTL